MSIAALLLIAVGAVAFMAAMAFIAMTTRRRPVECPETGTVVAVSVDCKHALKALFTGEHLRVTHCERWPERKNCDRSCAKLVHVWRHRS